jgi:hypothetical protein
MNKEQQDITDDIIRICNRNNIKYDFKENKKYLKIVVSISKGGN